MRPEREKSQVDASAPSLGRPPRAAAGLILQPPGSSDEVYLVERRPDLAFFGGYYAFPGGTVDADDESVPIAGAAGDAPGARADLAAAARELFEETGVLLAVGSAMPAAEERAGLRERMLAGELRFAPLLASRGLSVDAARLEPVCRMTTPRFSAARYDTAFYRVTLRPEEAPTVVPGELVRGGFFGAQSALAAWRGGGILIVPPVLLLLRLLAESSPAAERTARFHEAAARLTERYRRGVIHQVHFSPGVRMLTLITETRPPADHTNAYLVGENTAYLVDPGATLAGEQAKLFDALEESFAGGGGLAAVILTHHHPDHVGAAGAVADRYGIPIWSHAATAAALEGRVAVSRRLSDGEEIPLGDSPDGRGGWTLTALHTPGHAPGHLAFQESRYHAILAGDMVSTASTIVVGPPEGDLIAYLASLRRLRALPAGTIYPAHGPARRDSHAVLDGFLAHRARREEKIVGAIREAPRSADELLPVAYDDATPQAIPFARTALLGGLAKLVAERRVEERAGRYYLTATGA